MKYIKEFEKHISLDEMSDYHRIVNMAYLNNINGIKKLIINGNVDINSRNNDNCTPLMYLASRNRYDVIKEFIELGADIFLVDKNGHDFVDYADNREKALEVLENFPELYKEYIEQKEIRDSAKKYNI